MNAVMAYLGLIHHTVHCRDEEPEECAANIIPFIRENYGNPKIAMIGYQPAILEALSKHYALRVLDLDPDRIGSKINGVMVEDGESAMREVLDWCQLIVSTGSTLSNGTISNFLNTGREIVFYGTTIAGAAHLMGWKRYCACAR